MLSFVGKAGAAQTEVQRLFAPRPILRNGNPRLVLAPLRERSDGSASASSRATGKDRDHVALRVA
jgi:hypothetical protein